jgi:radical SAM protein with 4Fe4S-binding SPASM domain
MKHADFKKTKRAIKSISPRFAWETGRKLYHLFKKVKKNILSSPQCCRAPFINIEVTENGDVYPCCAEFINFYKFGNIFQNSYDEIWNGEKACAFRKSCWSQKYEYCNRNICWQAYDDKKNIIKNYDAESGKCRTYPKQVDFSFDSSCNVRCITCRDKHYMMPQEENERLEKLIPVLLPLVKDAELVQTNGSGEVFVSKALKHLCSEISKKYPDIKFHVHSNGILFNEKNCVAYFGGADRLYGANISIHAAAENTYKKIVRDGNFELVMRNIKWLSALKKEGKLSYLGLIFVVSSLNFHEMKQFLELAINLNATADFRHLRLWGSDYCKEYKQHACFLPEHPNYRDVAAILKDPLFDSPHCLMNGVIKNIKKGIPANGGL